jgi:hypothetical protein
MTKVLFILSALVMIVATVFAYQNGRKLSTIRTEAASIHSQIKTELRGIGDVVGEIGKVRTDVEGVQTKLDTENEKLKNFRLQIAKIDTESSNVGTDYKAKTATMNELNGKLAKLPAGFNPQTIVEDLNRIRQETVEFETAAQTKKAEVEAEQAKVAAAEKQLDEVVARVESRKKAFERNGLEATIVAVNADWGFVIINAGDREGITPDTKLIVTRGTQSIGKLNVLSVAGNRTVCNVLGDSLSAGLQPSPGDKVILENLVQ